jgi:hypothetical protein
MEVVLSDEDLQKVYSWVDEIPLSRSKRNITRDMSDGGAFSSGGWPRPRRAACRIDRDAHARPLLRPPPPPPPNEVLLAEIVRHYFPKLIDMHNYSSANSVRQKMYNWATLNQKVRARNDARARALCEHALTRAFSPHRPSPGHAPLEFPARQVRD